jgi:predicted GIY-YIG superfamily endonuclease
VSDQIGHTSRCHLYRLRDASGALLYVGVTTDVNRRLAEHRMSKSWAEEIARVEVDDYPSRWRAALAERAAARGEVRSSPRWYREGYRRGDDSG